MTAPPPSPDTKVHISMTDSHCTLIRLETYEILCTSGLKLLSHTRKYHLFGLGILAPTWGDGSPNHPQLGTSSLPQSPACHGACRTLVQGISRHPPD